MWNKLNIALKLAIINLGIFILIKLLTVLLGSNFIDFFAVSGEPQKIIFNIWTPLTYMFVDNSFMSVFSNMLWLYFIGQIWLEHISNRNFVLLYILGGLIGAVFYIIVVNLLVLVSGNQNIYISILSGAAAAVMTIVVSIATYEPHQKLYFWGILKLELWHLAAFMIVVDLLIFKLSPIQFANIGAGTFGFLYGSYMKNGKNILDKSNSKKKYKIKNKKLRISKNNLKVKNDYDYNSSKLDIQAETDRILDKISKKGYNSLSKKEREFLKNNS